MTQNKKDIICLAFPFWEGEYAKSTVQLMSILAKEYRILYIDYQCTLKDLISGLLGDRKIPVKRILGISKRLRKIKTREGDTVHVLTPYPVIPINWVNNNKLYDFLLYINNKIIRRNIKKASRRLKFKNPTVINAYNPFFGLYNIKKLNEDKVIYYCYDEISGSPWASKHGKRIEGKFLSQVDTVITTSEELYNSKSKNVDSCYLIKNGVDFKLFRKKIISENTKSKKIIGYVGSVDERLDYKLLKYLIENINDVEFHFVGRIVFPELVEPLLKYENVYLHGAVNYEKVPLHVSNFDICLIPFLKNDYTKNIYPLKINEYLALGKTVVTTSFTNLEEFKEYVLIANDKESFLKTMKHELTINEVNTDINTKRIEFSSSNSWENRAADFKKVINL